MGALRPNCSLSFGLLSSWNQYGYEGGDNFSVLLTLPLRRACTRPLLDLMECNVGAGYFSVVVVYSWMWCFLQRLSWIELKQNVHYDVIERNI